MDGGKANLPIAPYAASEWSDAYFLKQALANASMSSDPNTRVGAVIVAAESIRMANGWNRFPAGIAVTMARLEDRETKLRLMVHAEMVAILWAAKHGVCLRGGTLYLAATDDSGLTWGGPPCTRCCVEIIEAGITQIVSLPQKSGLSKWHDDLNYARTILSEAGIGFREVSLVG